MNTFTRRRTEWMDGQLPHTQTQIQLGRAFLLVTVADSSISLSTTTPYKKAITAIAVASPPLLSGSHLKALSFSRFYLQLALSSLSLIALQIFTWHSTP